MKKVFVAVMLCVFFLSIAMPGFADGKFKTTVRGQYDANGFSQLALFPAWWVTPYAGPGLAIRFNDAGEKKCVDALAGAQFFTRGFIVAPYYGIIFSMADGDMTHTMPAIVAGYKWEGDVISFELITKNFYEILEIDQPTRKYLDPEVEVGNALLQQGWFAFGFPQYFVGFGGQYEGLHYQKKENGEWLRSYSFAGPLLRLYLGELVIDNIEIYVDTAYMMVLHDPTPDVSHDTRNNFRVYLYVNFSRYF